MTKSHLFSSLLLFAGLAWGLEVSPESPCAKRCMDARDNDPLMRNSSLTSNDMLSCFDWEYEGNNATDIGRKFADCNRCLQSSGHEDVKSKERDTAWFMFNNRATVDWCLFGRFAEENNSRVATTYPYQQCNSKCQPIYTSVDYRIKKEPDGYAYCDYKEANFTSDAVQCTSCLYAASGLTILGNILATISEMCQSKPEKVLDLNFDGDIYAASRVQVVSTASATTSPSSSPTASDGISASTTSPTSSSSSGSGISKGALAGIVLGALIGIALILAGILFLLRRLQNKNKVVEIGSGSEPSMAYAGSHGYSSVSQQKNP